MATAVPGSRPRRSVTALLAAWSRGEESALNELMPIVQSELRALARRLMRGERGDHTLQTTALVNEAYVRLVDLSRVHWQDRAHFFAMSARLMRRILVDAARAQRYQKRGGGAVQVTLGDDLIVAEPQRDLVALDDALNELAGFDERKSKVVEMRFFGGLTVEETAEALGISVDTVMRDWKLAKAWLLRELKSAG